MGLGELQLLLGDRTGPVGLGRAEAREPCCIRPEDGRGGSLAYGRDPRYTASATTRPADPLHAYVSNRVRFARTRFTPTRLTDANRTSDLAAGTIPSAPVRPWIAHKIVAVQKAAHPAAKK